MLPGVAATVKILIGSYVSSAGNRQVGRAVSLGREALWKLENKRKTVDVTVVFQGLAVMIKGQYFDNCKRVHLKKVTNIKHMRNGHGFPRLYCFIERVFAQYGALSEQMKGDRCWQINLPLFTNTRQ